MDIGGRVMPSQGQSLEVVWLPENGRQQSRFSEHVQFEVVAGLMLDLAFAIQDATRIELRLTFSGQRLGSGMPGTANPRFVVIPLNDSSLLLGVAEPSDEPAALTPVASTPVLLGQGGSRIVTKGGLLSVRGSDRIGIDVDFVPGVGAINACVLRIRAAPGGCGEAGQRQPRLGLSLLRLREDAMRIVVGPSQAGEDAI